MTDFVLLGMRAPGDRPVSPARIARDLAATAAWHRQLRLWGLLRSYGLLDDTAGNVRACLIVRASGPVAALALAAGWADVSGYRVSVIGLSESLPAEGAKR